MTTFSYYNHGSQAMNQRGARGSDMARPPSEKMKAFYLDLCKMHGIEHNEIMLQSAQALSREIERLRALPQPATDKQKEMIMDLAQELVDMGIKDTRPSQAFLDKLTGGRDGTASQLIEKMQAIIKRNEHISMPTQKDLEFLVSMFLCPDIPFEEMGANRRIPITKLTAWGSDYSVEAELEARIFRKPTPSEFADIIRKATHINSEGEVVKSFTRTSTMRFIDQYRGVFFNWKRTRITANQIQRIRELEKRFAMYSKPHVVEMAWDDEEQLSYEINTAPSRERKVTQYTYEPIDELQLMMMSQDEASDYINRLTWELDESQQHLYRFFEESDESQTFESIRQAQDEHAWKIKEFTALNDLMYKLEAIAGYKNEAIHVIPWIDKTDRSTYINDAFLTGEDESNKKKRKEIRDFMLYLLQEGYTNFGALMMMCEDSEVAQEILLGQ